VLLLYGKVKTGVYKLYLSKILSKKRFNHSINVANQAISLAETFGEDKQKAYLAGLLHDICKEMDFDEQENLVINSTLNVCEVERNSQPLWHAIAGAEFVKSHFQIGDEDIINSIRWHTVGRANMSNMEKIVYLADLVSIDREYKDVKKMRKLCFKDLDEAMLEAFKFAFIQAFSKNNTIPIPTLEGYNQLTYMKNRS